MKNRIYLGGIIFSLGILGVLSLLTIDLPLDSLPPEIREQFSDQELKLFTLINPAILLLLSTIIGTLLHEKAGLGVPLIGRLAGQRTEIVSPGRILLSGIGGGILAGALILFVIFSFRPLLPEEFMELGQNLKMSLAGRLLYGGITEEILLRFGLMTLIVWLLKKISGTLSGKIYWIAVIISALIFASGHLPVVFNAVEDPSGLLILYIMLGNTIGGIIFGALYWKRGLESAMIAHMMAHIIMVTGESLFT